ncbi:MAG: hypothetical protein LBM97_01810 [Candidatus Nomurabacteria bacterium]|jgi:hypothetical protein|nr:hypothetical protein [Candidatus Nomurabacteria bacterium]
MESILSILFVVVTFAAIISAVVMSALALFRVNKLNIKTNSEQKPTNTTETTSTTGLQIGFIIIFGTLSLIFLIVALITLASGFTVQSAWDASSSGSSNTINFAAPVICLIISLILSLASFINAFAGGLRKKVALRIALGIVSLSFLGYGATTVVSAIEQTSAYNARVNSYENRQNCSYPTNYYNCYPQYDNITMEVRPVYDGTNTISNGTAILIRTVIIFIVLVFTHFPLFFYFATSKKLRSALNK